MTKFYEMTPRERRQCLIQEGILTENDANTLESDIALDDTVANNLIENQIGQFALPLGVARGLIVNGKKYDIPMVVEEPSVVAAANNGARIFALNGGTTAQSPAQHTVLAEIVFDTFPDGLDNTIHCLQQHHDDIITCAAQAKPSILQRGGGLRKITIDTPGRFIKIVLTIDVQAAMGANIANTIAEAVAHLCEQWVHSDALTAILTNLAPEPTIATVTLKTETLATKNIPGERIAQKIVALSELATCDIDRAVTHNKGIMNGITSAVLATGNDTRAVEAGAHCYAARNHQYYPLAQWDMTNNLLHGRIEVPLQVGIVGGAIRSLPTARIAQKIGRYHSVQTYQNILASLGLAQNLAALRALVGPGIQKGHMALHARNLALTAGAHGDEIALTVQKMQSTAKDLASAKQILQEIRAARTIPTV
ncbi:MAG: hydroxymethylglutaryl-CoA reductase, degradative [Aeriscardovia sp.]|nr:hydroxymethylglutaryl-CoA reductase, degradative [Aeriscardovia sp.]MBR3359317.1 hydroxymethylglutaryl-CoA reductase, degradative [Aeriscardovia sp.]